MSKHVPAPPDLAWSIEHHGDKLLASLWWAFAQHRVRYITGRDKDGEDRVEMVLLSPEEYLRVLTGQKFDIDWSGQ